jgi:hypothetical protein
VITKAKRTEQGVPRFLVTILTGAAQDLYQRLRTLGLVGAELVCAQAATLRTKLLNVGDVIVHNTWHIRFFFFDGSSTQQVPCSGYCRCVARTPNL